MFHYLLFTIEVTDFKIIFEIKTDKKRWMGEPITKFNTRRHENHSDFRNRLCHSRLKEEILRREVEEDL